MGLAGIFRRASCNRICKFSWWWAKTLPWRWLPVKLVLNNIWKLVSRLISFVTSKLSTQLPNKSLNCFILLTLRRWILLNSSKFLKRFHSCSAFSTIRTAPTVDSISSTAWWCPLVNILNDLVSKAFMLCKLFSICDRAFFGRNQSPEFASWLFLFNESPFMVVLPLFSRGCVVQDELGIPPWRVQCIDRSLLRAEISTQIKSLLWRLMIVHAWERWFVYEDFSLVDLIIYAGIFEARFHILRNWFENARVGMTRWQIDRTRLSILSRCWLQKLLCFPCLRIRVWPVSFLCWLWLVCS